MAISDKITSITNHLIDDYKALENLGADLTNVDKNIENIAELLDGVYDRLPKTEYQEGTEVNLGVTSKGKLDFENGVVGIGQSSQDSTTGDNLVGLQDSSGSINGITYKVENGVVTLNGTATSTTENYNISKIISNGDINFNTSTHSIKWYYEGILPQGTARGYIGITEYYYNYLIMLTGETSPHNMVIHNGDNIRIRFEQGIAFNNFKIKLMINEGTTIKDYEQYSGGYSSPSPNWGQEIKRVTGNQDVVVSGKNLVPFPYYDSDVQDRNGVNWSVNSNGTINASGTANASSSIFYLTNGDADIYLDAGTYKISTNLFTDENGFSIQAIKIVNGSYSTVYWNDIVLTERTRLRVRIIAKPNATVNVQNAYLMIEPGSTATTYEPYITPTSYQLSLGDKKLYDECYIVGSPDNWKFVDKLKYIKATSDFTISKSGSTANVLFNVQAPTITNEIETPATNNTVVSDIYCNIAKGGYSANQLYASNIIGISINVYKAIQLGLGANSEIDTVEKLKTYFDNNDVYFIYPLATPIETPITDETLINQLNAWYNAHSLNGTTIITSNGNLPMIIKVRGLKGE